MKIKIYSVNKGIASRYPNYIEINKKLIQDDTYKPLYFEILNHELSHTNKGYTTNDLLLDLKGFENKKLYYKFLFTTLSAWYQFLPIVKSRGKYYLDGGLCIIYSIVIIITIIFYVITRAIN